MKSTTDPAYSAFISYSGDDDLGQHGWISNFRDELERTLRARMRGHPIAPFQMYQRNGAVGGELLEELEKKVRSSVAMMLFVHENYLSSEACKQELSLFRNAFGAEAFKKRFFIVAMSRPAVEALVASAHWRNVVPFRELVWSNFYRPDEPGKPMPIYVAGRPVADQPLIDRMDPLVDALEACLRAGPLPLVAGAPMAAPPVRTQRLVFGVARPELKAEIARLADILRQGGREVELLPEEALIKGMPQLLGADSFVLAFNDGMPLAPYVPAGHLAMQHKAWAEARKREGELRWLDLRDIAAPEDATAEHREQLRKLVLHPVTREELVGRGPPRPCAELVRIYIESNKNELDEWDVLGEQIKRRWSAIAQGVAPPLELNHAGLPIDDMRGFESLENADGFVLLWGKKEPSSLVAQINQVEGRIPKDRDLPPGIVAYLMPPQPDMGESVPAWGWKVLRFNAQPLDRLDVVDKEADRLDTFLRKILDRVQRRRGLPLALA